MYSNTGYLSGVLPSCADTSAPLVITGCGNYRLQSRDFFSTVRPEGRPDYQLLYIAAGAAHFVIDGKYHRLDAGHMVLYRPEEPQSYYYELQDHPDVYWLHFSGSQTEEFLQSFDLPSLFFAGVFPAYAQLFSDMIRELQTVRADTRELLTLYLHQLLLLVRRFRKESPAVSSRLRMDIEAAAAYFSSHCAEPLSVEEYAKSCGMSVSWFLRSFRQVCGQSPLQYILTARIRNAAALLESTRCNVTEIAALVGCDNPLYFSRLFKKHTGLSPTEYRKMRERS